MSVEPRSRRALLGVGISLAGLLLLFWALGGGRRAAGGTSWAEVKRLDLVVAVDVTGTLEAVASELLGPPAIPRTWNYEISFMIPEGTEVEAGTPVLAFDTAKLERTLQESQAEMEKAGKEIEKLETNLEIRRRKDELELAEAEGKLRLAKLKLDQPSEVVAAGETAEAALDLELASKLLAFHTRRLELIAEEERTSLGTVRERRDRAARRVTEIKEQIQRMTVKAPKAGTVIYVSDYEGKKPKVGESSWRGAKVLEIPDLSRMRAAGEVAEIAAGRVAAGQRASFRLDAHPDIVFRGRVLSIERAVKQRSDSDPTKVFRLQIELDQTDPERMRPGMRFQGSIEIERIPEALQVPTAAVFATERGPVVYRAALVGQKTVHPRLGRRSGAAVEVLEGLREGERVALLPPEGKG